MSDISRRSILGGLAAAPAAVGMAGAEMARMAQLAQQRTIDIGRFNPTVGPFNGLQHAPSLSPEMKAARRALRKLESTPIQTRITWVDGMKSWTPSTRARAIIEIHNQIEREKSTYQKILGYFMDDDE